MREAEKKTMFDDAGPGFKFERKLCWIGYRTEVAIENQIALVGVVLPAVCGLPDNILRAQ